MKKKYRSDMVWQKENENQEIELNHALHMPQK